MIRGWTRNGSHLGQVVIAYHWRFRPINHGSGAKKITGNMFRQGAASLSPKIDEHVPLVHFPYMYIT